jgi:hypothetical protein
MIDSDSKQEILREISAIRALLTQLQPVSDGGRKPQQQLHEDTTQAGGGKRVLILF